MSRFSAAALLCLALAGVDVATGLQRFPSPKPGDKRQRTLDAPPSELGSVMASAPKAKTAASLASWRASPLAPEAVQTASIGTGSAQGLRFAAAEKAWLRRFDTTRHCKEYVPSAFMEARPETCPGNMARLGHAHADGGWDVCDHKALRTPGCVAYLFGAGYDISFDISLALKYPQCEIFTIDPTPGLKEHLSTLKGVASMLPARPDLKATLQSLGSPPKNWHHVNVGIHSSGAVQQWGASGVRNFWATGRLFKGTSGNVHLLPLHSIMERLGHHRIDVVKIDAEGAEWGVYDQLVNRSIGVHQLMIELHGPGRVSSPRARAASWLKFYHEMMRTGFTLVAQQPTRYSNSGKDVGRKPDRIWRHSDARLHNFTRGCEHPLGEFAFFREQPTDNRPAVWRYTDEAYQDEN